jgi:hypothetical protein
MRQSKRPPTLHLHFVSFPPNPLSLLQVATGLSKLICPSTFQSPTTTTPSGSFQLGSLRSPQYSTRPMVRLQHALKTNDHSEILRVHSSPVTWIRGATLLMLASLDSIHTLDGYVICHRARVEDVISDIRVWRRVSQVHRYLHQASQDGGEWTWLTPCGIIMVTGSRPRISLSLLAFGWTMLCVKDSHDSFRTLQRVSLRWFTAQAHEGIIIPNSGAHSLYFSMAIMISDFPWLEIGVWACRIEVRGHSFINISFHLDYRFEDQSAGASPFCTPCEPFVSPRRDPTTRVRHT